MALRNGSRLHVGMQDVFPHGCHLVPDSIIEAQDYDEKHRPPVPGDRQADRAAGVLVPGDGHGPGAGGPLAGDGGQDPGRPDAGPADPGAVRAGGVRGPAGDPVRG